MGQQIQGARFGIVQVLQHQEQRLTMGDIAEKSDDRLEQPPALRLRVTRFGGHPCDKGPELG
jgi:hypothetical protein